MQLVFDGQLLYQCPFGVIAGYNELLFLEAVHMAVERSYSG
jgi:hypothetical protein